MPKETFFNLTEDKRKKIETAAISEFGQYNFDTSSVNRIVANSGISKGSFYQYFDDKKDLYKHIVNGIVDKKLSYMSSVMMNPYDHDFFTLIREMYMSGLKFAQENTELLNIGNWLIADPNHELYKELLKENLSKSDNVFESLMLQAIARGQIREDIDIKMIAFLISSLNVSIAEYYQKYVNQVVDDKIMEIVDNLLDFIKFGIGSRK